MRSQLNTISGRLLDENRVSLTISEDVFEFLVEKAEALAKDTVELVKEKIPEKVDEVKSAFNDFVKSCNLPFSL